MNLVAALRAAAVSSALLLVSACGGGDVTDMASSAAAGNTGSGNRGGSTVSHNCQPQTTVVAGNLFVAEEGPIGVTLLSDGGLGPLTFDDLSTFGRGFMVLYDNVYGMQVASNPQDRFGYVKPFPPGTVPGASARVELQPPPPDFIIGAVPVTYPKGIPLQLWLKISDGNPPSTANSSGTASIGKDLWPYPFPTASVMYGTNNTATVTFFGSTEGAHFSVGLTNVFGTDCPGS